MRRWFQSMLNRTTLISVVGLLALFLATLWAAEKSNDRVDQAVRQNFTAAGFLSKLQVEGERMRRFEKEMFIYVAVPDKRAGYVKEYNQAYEKALALLDTMLAPSSKTFSDDERKTMSSWKAAAIFYYGEFDRLSRQAETLSLSTLTADQRAALTLQYNDGIKAGKDRFRELLNGTAEMRLAKETRSQSIAGELDSIFSQLVKLVALVAALLALGIALTTSRLPRQVAARTAFGNTRGAAPSEGPAAYEGASVVGARQRQT
jgi:hypothetical protein